MLFQVFQLLPSTGYPWMCRPSAENTHNFALATINHTYKGQLFRTEVAGPNQEATTATTPKATCLSIGGLGRPLDYPCSPTLTADAPGLVQESRI